MIGITLKKIFRCDGRKGTGGALSDEELKIAFEYKNDNDRSESRKKIASEDDDRACLAKVRISFVDSPFFELDNVDIARCGRIKGCIRKAVSSHRRRSSGPYVPRD